MSIGTIRARLQAATPGPWNVQRDDYSGNATLVSDGDGVEVSRFVDDADASLIAHAPDDLTALLRVAEAAQEVASNHGSFQRWDIGYIFALRDALAALEKLP